MDFRAFRRVAADDQHGEPYLETEPVTPGQETPHSCSYCGGEEFEAPTDNGRVMRAECSTCHGTMVSHGGTWMPDLIGQPDNHPADNADPRSGGVAGAGAVPVKRREEDLQSRTAAMDGHVLLHRGVGDYSHTEGHTSAEGWWADHGEMRSGFGRWWDPDKGVAKHYSGVDSHAGASGVVVSAHFPAEHVREATGSSGHLVTPGTEGHVHSVEMYHGNGDWKQLPHTPGMKITAMPGKRPPPADLSFTIEPDPSGHIHDRNRPGWNHQILRAHLSDDENVGSINFSAMPSPDGPGPHLKVHTMEVLPRHQSRGIASAMQDQMHGMHPGHEIDHGTRTEDGHGWAAQYRTAEADWCRHRHAGHCWLPAQAPAGGVALYIPQDRGICPWKTASMQQINCPVSEPGPMAGMAHAGVRKMDDGTPLVPVKHAGFKGFVEAHPGHHDELDEMDAAIDGHKPEPLDEDEKPTAHHADLINFISDSHGTDNSFWHKHGEVGPVPIHKGVYATQPHVVQHHLDRYHKNPADLTDAVHELGANPKTDANPANHMPMFVKHEGNLFAVDGHHRTSAALTRGDKHVHGITYDADKHGWPENSDGFRMYDNVGHDGISHYSALRPVIDCDYADHPHAAGHALLNHDDGICVATEARRGHRVTGTRHEAKFGTAKHLSWDEIGERHPHIYGDEDVHGEEAEGGDGWGIGDAANQLAHDRAEDPGAENTMAHDLRFHEDHVHPKHVDYARNGGLSDPRVRHAYEGFKSGADVPPAVLVHRHGVYQVADGHHRAEAAHLAGVKLPAYVAHSPHQHEPTSDGDKAPYHGAEPIEVHDPHQKQGNLVTALADTEFRFHVLATWFDVRNKAKRIRSEGGVSIVSNLGDGLTGHVNGDTGVYETQINYVPGTYKIGFWQCGCAWASYAWGRSQAFKRFEGRMCSHALALQYEAQSRGMFGKEVREDTRRPEWMRDKVRVRHDRDTRDHDLRAAALSALDPDGFLPNPSAVELERAPIHTLAQGAYQASGDPAEALKIYMSAGLTHAEARPLLQNLEQLGAGLEIISAKGERPEEPTHAGVALKAADTGRILMIQRSHKDPDDPAAGTWEFPGGGREDGDHTSLHSGIREFQEEVGQPFPTGGHVSHVWQSGNGVYQGHVVVVPSEDHVDFSQGRSTVNPDDPDGDDHEQSAWWHPDDARKNPALRPECRQSPWDKIKTATLARTADYGTLAAARPRMTPELRKQKAQERGPQNAKDWGNLPDDHPAIGRRADRYRTHGDRYRLYHDGDSMISAHVRHGDGYREVGRMLWHDGENDPDHSSNVNGGTIANVRVSEQHRRSGVASAMLDFAREIRPDVRHSTVLSEDGASWAEKKATFHDGGLEAFRRKVADYASHDALEDVGVDWRPKNPPKRIEPGQPENPGSTGFATGQDPPEFDQAGSQSSVPSLSSWSSLDDSLDFGVMRVDPEPPGTGPTRSHALKHDGELHDSSEAALPSTTADDEQDVIDDPGAQYRSTMTSNVDETASIMPSDGRTASASDIVARFQATAGAKALQGTAGAGGTEMDIASAARNHLAGGKGGGISRTALKDFSAIEQAGLINEGMGQSARNLGDLKIEGTHYEALAEAMAKEQTLGQDLGDLFD